MYNRFFTNRLYMYINTVLTLQIIYSFVKLLAVNPIGIDMPPFPYKMFI